MRIETHQGVPVWVPRAGSLSYDEPAQKVIAALVPAEKRRYEGHATLEEVRITRVLNEHDPATVRVYYSSRVKTVDF